MWKKIHVKIEYLRCSSYSSPGPFFFSVFLVLLLQVPFFFVLGFFVFFHGFLSSSCSFYSHGDCSSSSFVGHFFLSILKSSSFFFRFFFLFYETQVFKTRVLCGKNMSMSAIDLESLRLNFFTELKFPRLEMLVF